MAFLAVRLSFLPVRLELFPVQGLILGLKLRVLPLQNPYPVVPILYRFTVIIDDPQMLMVHIVRPPILSQHPFCGQSVQIRADVLIGADKIVRWPGMPGHAYLFSKLSISQFTFESF